MELSFIKMHGLGNDFVILDGRQSRLALGGQAVRDISDRRRGVGCDQLIILEKSQEADVFMRIYNPDGSQAGACGNATRCVADLMMRELNKAEITIQTISGIMECTRTEGVSGHITVNMGAPRLAWEDIPLAEAVDTLHLPLAGDPVGVSMGNPHCVFFCGNAEDVDVGNSGVKVEHDGLFPDRTNVEYVSILGTDHLRMRVWERGAGITQACGTGACASAVAAIRRGLTGRKVTVTLDGGDLQIEWREADGHVYMTGPVAYAFEGRLELS
jgi:diaminopimelate epimerase